MNLNLIVVSNANALIENNHTHNNINKNNMLKPYKGNKQKQKCVV